MLQIPWLAPDLPEFPDTHEALDEPDGLLAAGGDLTSNWLQIAYRRGIFPWFSDDQPILWWSPSPREVLFPQQMHISRSLRKALRKNDYQVTADAAFPEVINACAAPRQSQDGETWITDAMQQAYMCLHQQGLAHSIEVWQQQQLIGGLYGVSLGKVFFGESMFARRSNASKIAFAHLCQQLVHWDFAMIDCQVATDHLKSLGSEAISREEFEKILRTNVDKTGKIGKIGPWNLLFKHEFHF